MDDPVVMALREALKRADSPELRLALGARFLEKGESKSALEEYEAALRLTPANALALEGAAKAAKECGDAVRATAYELARAAAASGRELKEEEAAATATDEGAPTAVKKKEDEGPRLKLVAQDGQLLTEDEGPSAVRFDDVGGMDEVKERLTRSFLQPLRNPELHKKFGKRIGGGLVLYGPPGCGKTFLARAVAGEIGARFVNVGLSDVLDMWFGESERHLHEIFESARRRAPTLLFFDEVDALGQRRTQLKGMAGRTLVNQFLTEMDGFAGRNEAVFVLGATNSPWDLDPALRRPGRFDRLVFVPPPDLSARKRIFELKLRDKPHAGRMDLDLAAKQTDGFSGADLDAVVETATELAIDASIKGGSERVIDDTLLARALRDTRPSARPWFETARNFVLYANEGGLYDELLTHLRKLGLA
ncbi:MAG: AAA family ATPase [Myxococcales bacterium]